MQTMPGGMHPMVVTARDREMVKMGKSFLARVPMPVKLGLPVAAGLLAAACGSAAGATAGSAPAGGARRAGRPPER